MMSLPRFPRGRGAGGRSDFAISLPPCSFSSDSSERASKGEGTRYQQDLKAAETQEAVASTYLQPCWCFCCLSCHHLGWVSHCTLFQPHIRGGPPSPPFCYAIALISPCLFLNKSLWEICLHSSQNQGGPDIKMKRIQASYIKKR